jgi:hypothetical protein
LVGSNGNDARSLAQLGDLLAGQLSGEGVDRCRVVLGCLGSYLGGHGVVAAVEPVAVALRVRGSGVDLLALGGLGGLQAGHTALVGRQWLVGQRDDVPAGGEVRDPHRGGEVVRRG